MRSRAGANSRSNALKNKTLRKGNHGRKTAEELLDPAVQAQLKLFDEAVRYFQQQKLHKAQQVYEKVLTGPSKELADRAGVHLRICQQRIARPPVANLRSADDHYHHGVAMMNLGHWDEAREHLEKAKKLAPKCDYIHYALAALDCLIGETDSAMAHLKAAIELRPENRYHARNDEDFASLQEDPRFTELLYPEREFSA
ncbi:MAG: tetratricopeptide repeat protein [Acidobacteria bacterium]|nr:tetratricopeptide repeat protein [Acidobacteriota bacterium]MBI3663891.1 tetratricopeptide repeat protein [Acidobacteriota bacterium]